MPGAVLIRLRLYLDVPSTQTDFSLQGWLILGDVFADEVIEYNLKTSAGILYFIVVEVFQKYQN